VVTKEKKKNGNVEITRRLDALIALLAQPSEGKTAKIAILRNAGLRPTEIATILIKPLSYVTATLAQKKKGGKKKTK
jgi:hypothetical protein